MPRGNQVARLYALVMDLARSRRGVPVARLAERHGWNLRTVYRDLDALQAAGFPVTREENGAKWKMIDDWRGEIPFPLTSGELLSLFVARDLMGRLEGVPAAKHFDSLMRKLALPRARRTQGQGQLFPVFDSPLSTPSILAIDYAPHEEMIAQLWQARSERRTVSCEYYTASRDEVTQRLLDPYALHYDPVLEALYLFAWCHARREVRTFAVHRFRAVETTDERFEQATPFDVDRHLRGALRIWRAKNAQRVVLRLEPSARWVAERRWHASQRTEDLTDGSIEIELTVGDEVELRRFLLGLGAAVRIVRPASLRRQIAAEHRAAAETSGPRAGAGARDRLTLVDNSVGKSGARGRG